MAASGSDRRDGADSPNQLTIEQLAAESGMSVRNIRSHQARGLLAPPEVRLRVGYYGPEHVAQLRLIRDLQAEGFNLAGIKRLLDDTQGTAERLMRFKDSLAEHRERAETLTLGELGRRFRVSAEQAPRVLAKTEKVGVLIPAGEGRYEVPSPSLLAVAEEVVDRGMPVEALLAVFEELDTHCDAVARAFVKLFVTQVWRPFQRAGMPAERWPEIDEAIDRLRPLATDALLAIFSKRMDSQIEAAFGEITQRLSERAPA
jgi:DNA-binding transcriptional MerR regulator